LQIERQPVDDLLLILIGAHLVPRHLDAHPFAGPVARKPGDEVRLGALANQIKPLLQGIACEMAGLLGSVLRRGNDFAVDLPPGTRGNGHGRGPGRTAGQHDDPDYEQEAPLHIAGPDTEASAGRSTPYIQSLGAGVAPPVQSVASMKAYRTSRWQPDVYFAY